jgi:hypothetical protein
VFQILLLTLLILEYDALLMTKYTSYKIMKFLMYVFKIISYNVKFLFEEKFTDDILDLIQIFPSVIYRMEEILIFYSLHILIWIMK